MTPLTITSTLNEIWRKTKLELERVLPQDVFESWFSSVECIGGDDDKILLSTPSVLAPYWIIDNYSDILSQNLALAASRNIKFDLTYVERELVASGNVSGAEVATHRATEESVDMRQLRTQRAVVAEESEVLQSINPRNTFENFVVGEANQLAHATALAVAQTPGKAFNPLFLYGATGLGKTHLMHSIAHFIIKNNPSARVLFVSSETFVNDYIKAVMDKNIPSFHRKYRAVDVLLIDDIQFLSGKEASQNEFFHTFNELTNANKQVVLSCDKAPSEVEDLEKRLVSRFEWGMCVDIKQPDYETRLAILRRKLSSMGDSVSIDPNVLDLIARRFTKNVRRMEGALNKLIGYCSLINSGEVLTLEKATFLLADALNYEDEGATVDIEKIQQVVAEYNHIDVAELCGKRRTELLVQARHIAMYLSKKLTSHTLQEIGKRFGGRNHGTVMHAIRVVDTSMQNSESFARQIEYLKKSLSA